MVCLSSFLSLSLHDLQSIVKLWLIDTSTTVILHIVTTHPCTVALIQLIHTICMCFKQICRCKTHLPDSQKLWLSDWTYVLQNFRRWKTRLPDNQKTMTPWLNVHSANILCNAKCNMPSSDRRPLANNQCNRIEGAYSMYYKGPKRNGSTFTIRIYLCIVLYMLYVQYNMYVLVCTHTDTHTWHAKRNSHAA